MHKRAQGAYWGLLIANQLWLCTSFDVKRYLLNISSGKWNDFKSKFSVFLSIKLNMAKILMGLKNFRWSVLILFVKCAIFGTRPFLITCWLIWKILHNAIIILNRIFVLFLLRNTVRKDTRRIVSKQQERLCTMQKKT